MRKNTQDLTKRISMVEFLIIITFDRSGGFRSNKLHFKDQNLLQTHFEVTNAIIFAILQNVPSKDVKILLGQPVYAPHYFVLAVLEFTESAKIQRIYFQLEIAQFVTDYQKGVIPCVSEKKCGVEDYQYFMNSYTQECHIFGHDKYNLLLSSCVQNFQLHKVTKVMNARRMMSQTGLG